MMKKIILGIAIVLISSLSVAEERGPTLAQFTQFYTPQETAISAPLHHWIRGFSDGVATYYVMSKMDGQPTLFCLPDKFLLNKSLPRLIKSYLADYKKITGHTISDSAPLSGVALAALSHNYPCQRQQ